MRTCPVDGRPLTGQSTQKYCSEKCSKRARRAGSVVHLERPDAPGQPGDLSVSVRAELERVGRESSALGVSVLVLAARIDSGQESGSALAALNRELRATLAEALRGEQQSGVSSMRDELADRRAKAGA